MTKFINYPIDWFIEAAFLISNILRDSNTEISIEIKDEKLREEIQLTNEFIKNSKEKTEKILENHKEIRDIISDLENSEDLGKFALASLATLLRDNLDGKIDNNEMKILFFTKVFECEKANYPNLDKPEDCLSFDKYYKYLVQNHLEPKDIVNLLDLHMNFDKRIKDIIFLLKEVEKILIDESEIILPIVKKKEESIMEEELANTFNRGESFNFGKNTRKIISVIWNRSMSYFDYVNETTSFVFVGLHLLEIFKIRNDEETVDKKVSRLKAISDPIRYKILEMCLEKNTYLQEMSKELDMKPSSLSHHIQTMLNERVIVNVLENDNKKVYYSVNKEIIKKIISDLNKFV